MNQAPAPPHHSTSYLQNPHMSTAPSSYAQAQTPAHYPPYPQPPAGMQHSTSYTHGAPHQYGTYYTGVSSPQTPGHQGSNVLMPLQVGPEHPPSQYQSQSYQNHAYDHTGQVAPPGVKPRVTATLWEDEGSLCFQVEAKGVCVARREDNHFINGTKLLNVAGMTRGRRDGILKSEKTRHVVKIGPMHLKGVWIPYDRALDFANREKITDLLYPLFVHNIGALLYHPTNSNRTNLVMEAAKRRGLENKPASAGNAQVAGNAGAAQQHAGSLSTQHMASGAAGTAAAGAAGRPSMDRAHTFPTPPTSASSVLPSHSSSYDWSAQSIHASASGPNAVQPSGAVTAASQPLAIDTGLSNTRSLPATPASTPPGNTITGLHSYQGSSSAQGGYDAGRPPYSSGSGTTSASGQASATQGQTQYETQRSNLARFGQSMPPSTFIKHDMAPPSSVARPNGDAQSQGGHPADIKHDTFSHRHSSVSTGGSAAESSVTVQAGATSEEEAEHENDTDYGHDPASAYGAGVAGRSTYPGYSHIASEQVNGSPHQNLSTNGGRATPRATPVATWGPPGHQGSSSGVGAGQGSGAVTGGYSTPPRADSFPQTNYSTANGTAPSTKRPREDDELDYKSSPSRRLDGSSAEDIDSLKRLKSNMGNMMRPESTFGPRTIIRSSGRR